MTMPSPQDLNYFLAVAQAGSLSLAAKQLAVAQPSLTLAIQRLEKSVNSSLFIRTRKGVTLTKAGHRLLAESRDLVKRWESVRDLLAREAQEVRGRLLLGVHVSVAVYSLKQFLPDLLARHHDLEVHLLHDLSRTITQRVIDLEVDAGLVINPIRHPDLIVKPIASDEVTVWAAAHANEEILLVEPGLAQSQFILRRLRTKYRRTLECSSLEVIRALAEAGTGHAILPARVANSKKLKPVPNMPKFSDELCFIYRHEHRGWTSLQALAKAAQEGLR